MSDRLTSQKFQRRLSETRDFSTALMEVFADLVHLEIVTWVAHDGDQSHRPGNRLRTEINLIDGDIENELGADFLADSPYAELRHFHEAQVLRGGETIANNLKTLVEVGEKISNLLRREPSVVQSQNPEVHESFFGELDDGIDSSISGVMIR
jgi:hypothetical protein